MRITPEMIEAGARALHRIKRGWLMAWNAIVEPWQDISEAAKEAYREEARACLEDALGNGSALIDLVQALCDTWNAVAYHGNLKESKDWPLPDGVEQIQLRRGEVWFRYKDGREEFIRTM